jgi:hypothetical protein
MPLFATQHRFAARERPEVAIARGLCAAPQQFVSGFFHVAGSLGSTERKAAATSLEPQRLLTFEPRPLRESRRARR